MTLSSERAAHLLFALQKPQVRDTCLPGFDDAAWWLWTELIRHAPPGWVAPVATLIATTAFQQGRTTQARIAAEYALTDAPEYVMAATVLDVINRGMTPHAFTAAIAQAIQLANTPTAPSHDQPATSVPAPAQDTAATQAPSAPERPI